MKLILKVFSNEGIEINACTLNQETATIGRNAGNTLVLEDPKKYISGQHAVIEVRDSHYFVKDTSTNGVVINSAIQPLGNGNSVQLGDGDQLHIGDYVINVTIITEQQRPKAPVESAPDEVIDFFDDPFNDPFAELSSDSVQKVIEEEPWEIPLDWNEKKSITESSHNSTEEFFDLNRTKDEEFVSKVEQPLAFKEAFQPVLSAEKPKEKQKKQQSIDDIFGDDWPPGATAEQPSIETVNEISVSTTEPLEQNNSNETAEPIPVVSPVEKKPDQIEQEVQPVVLDQAKLSTTTTQTAQLIGEFLRGAGLENTDVDKTLTPESFYLMGKIIKASVQGTMDVLIGRAKIKNEMHLDVTTIKSRENNPIKFSVSAEEAIKKLLVPQDEGYLSAEEAIEEVFDDIRTHQFSVIAGMQTALLEVLKRFEPQKLEQRFQKQSPISSTIPIHKQAKLWDAFENLYQDIEHEATDNFYHLFGQAFADSYEEQMMKLKNSKKNEPF